MNGVQKSLDRLLILVTDIRREFREDTTKIHERISKHNERIESLVKETRVEMVAKMDRYEDRISVLEDAEQQRRGAQIVRGGLIGMAMTAFSALLAALLIALARKMGWLQ